MTFLVGSEYYEWMRDNCAGTCGACREREEEDEEEEEEEESKAV